MRSPRRSRVNSGDDVDISWAGRQLRMLRKRSGKGLFWAAAVLVVGVSLTTAVASVHRQAVALLFS